jgi:predicted ATPase/class 3 adenylate cyclase
MGDLPDGTVTFLFSDVEGSTRLLERHGDLLHDALRRHHELFAREVAAHHGAIFETVGDAVYAAFARPSNAVSCALGIQRAFAHQDWGVLGSVPVRIAVHTGQAERQGTHYRGNALFRAARLLALAHGEQTLLSGTTSQLVADTLPAGAGLRDLGTHRLRDLGAPEHVYQLVHDDLRRDFPPLRSLEVPHNLPVASTALVGREGEVAEVGGLLQQNRLVTLLGPGGIGKTRLALQAAADNLERYPDGAFFVDLSSVRDPQLIAPAISAVLGLRDQPGQPGEDALGEHLATKRLLLVMDNLEQVVPGAATVTAALLKQAPGVRVLATSRAPLRVRSEREYAVPPLPSDLPADGEAVPPAVQLFLERAADIGRQLALDKETASMVAEVCALCDGLPLAIELAAARLRLFTLSALHDRLSQRLPLLVGGAHDLPQRQKTLRATIGWSVDMLPEPERRLFARLGVFAGGFSLSAVEAVGGEDLDRDPADALDELVAQSLVRRDDGLTEEPRYTMLETIREYATELLDSLEDRQAIEDRHVTWLLDLVRAELDALVSAPSRQTFERLAPDLGNFRAALGRPLLAETRLALVASLWLLWDALGLLHEGVRWTEDALSRASGDTLDRARALRGAAILHSDLGNMTAASDRAEESLRIARRHGDDVLASLALNTLAVFEEDPEKAAALLTECLELQRRAGVAYLGPLVNLGWVAILRGDRDGAVAAYRASLAVADEVADQGARAASLTGLAWLALLANDPDSATQWAEGALEAGRLSGEPVWCAEAYIQLARADVMRGALERAADRLRHSIAELAHGEWEDRRQPMFTVMAELLLSSGDAARASLLLGAAATLGERWRDAWTEAKELDEALLRRALASGPEAEAAYAKGRALESSAAFALAGQWLEEWRQARASSAGPNFGHLPGSR